MTAIELLGLLAQFRPVIEDDSLGFEIDPPSELIEVATILQTGLRSLLTGRSWWAHFEAGKVSRFTKVAIVELDPSGLLPVDVVLLATEGDTNWDVIDPDSRITHPELFAFKINERVGAA